MRTQLLSNRGVRVDRVGTFSFARSGEPTFNIANDFGQLYRVKQVAMPLKDYVSSAKLNLTQLQGISGLSRDVTDKVLTRFIAFIGKSAQSGRSALVSINKVAEIYLKARGVQVTFIPDFLTNLANQNDGVSSLQSKRESGWNAKGGYKAPDFARQMRSDAAAKRREQDETLLLRPRPRNPLYDGDDLGDETPRSYSTGNASDYGPTPRARNTSAGRYGGKPQVSATTSDARKVAASAIGAQSNIVERMRERIIARGGATGIRGLGKVLSIMDDNGDKRLSKDELK